MTDKELIRTKLMELYKKHLDAGDMVCRDELLPIIDLMDETPDEPASEGLDDAVSRFIEQHRSELNGCLDLRRIARYFANWQREQMMEKAFMVELAKPKHAGQAHLCGCFSCGNSGDMVKIIII
jgi:hypothetical protein